MPSEVFLKNDTTRKHSPVDSGSMKLLLDERLIAELATQNFLGRRMYFLCHRVWLDMLRYGCLCSKQGPSCTLQSPRKGCYTGKCGIRCNWWSFLVHLWEHISGELRKRMTLARSAAMSSHWVWSWKESPWDENILMRWKYKHQSEQGTPCDLLM